MARNEMAEKRLTVVLNSDHSSRSHIVKALLLRGVIRCETGNVEKGLAGTLCLSLSFVHTPNLLPY